MVSVASVPYTYRAGARLCHVGTLAKGWALPEPRNMTGEFRPYLVGSNYAEAHFGKTKQVGQCRIIQPFPTTNSSNC